MLVSNVTLSLNSPIFTHQPFPIPYYPYSLPGTPSPLTFGVVVRKKSYSLLAMKQVLAYEATYTFYSSLHSGIRQAELASRQNLFRTSRERFLLFSKKERVPIACYWVTFNVRLTVSGLPATIVLFLSVPVSTSFAV
jgi:hypothetical protein